MLEVTDWLGVSDARVGVTDGDGVSVADCDAVSEREAVCEAEGVPDSDWEPEALSLNDWASDRGQIAAMTTMHRKTQYAICYCKTTDSPPVSPCALIFISLSVVDQLDHHAVFFNHSLK
jgi:hypothetical protein